MRPIRPANTANDGGSGAIDDNPGRFLRELRAKNRWTLVEVSERTGIPVSTLSKIETGKMSLSYEKLLRLSRGLSIDITQLFASTALPSPVSQPTTRRRSITPAGEGPSIKTATYNYIYPSSDLLNKVITPMIIEVNVRSLEEFGELMRHSGEEYVYVIEGQCEFHTDIYAPASLSVGDSVYFDASMGHGYVAIGEGPCRVLSVCSAKGADLKSAPAPVKLARSA